MQILNDPKLERLLKEAENSIEKLSTFDQVKLAKMLRETLKDLNHADNGNTDIATRNCGTLARGI